MVRQAHHEVRAAEPVGLILSLSKDGPVSLLMKPSAGTPKDVTRKRLQPVAAQDAIAI